jgi:uncharacterized protein YlzI (FlbEa/FlbD family)
MRLVKLEGQEGGPIYINPEHVVAVRKALRDTKVETVAGQHAVVGEPAQIARLLGAEELQIDITGPKLIER